MAGELRRGKNLVVEGFRTELDTSCDEGCLGIRVQGVEQIVPTALPLVITVKAEPNESLDAHTGAPSSLDYVIVEAIAITGAVEADVARLKSIPGILKFLLQLIGRLAS